MYCAGHCRTRSYKRGYKNVISAGVDLNAAGTDCQLMMETSGHGALKENYFLDDGAYLAVKVREKGARGVDWGAQGKLFLGRWSVAYLAVKVREGLPAGVWRM